MRIYVHDARRQRSPNRRGAEGDLPPLKPGTSWVRFGTQTLLYNDDDEVEARAAAPVSSRGARHPRRDVPTDRGRLHVVVQHGRLFQQRHPEVPVLHDRGRFLLVQLEPDAAAQMEREAETCYGLLPVAEDMVVFEERDRVPGRAAVPFITALVGRVARTELEATLQALTSVRTRFSTSAEYKGAAGRARERLNGLGYSTRVQRVAVGSGTSLNLLADKVGTGAPPRHVVMVTAHLDSVNHAGGPSAVAPGADDNGSGSAGVIEMARVFQKHTHRHDLRFALFGGEEQGLLGSRHYLRTLSRTERARIHAVVNMDMIGRLNNAARSVLIEGAAVSQAITDALNEAASTYTDLLVETSLHPFASDHVPFIEGNIPAVLTIEGSDNTNESVHSAGDTLDRIDLDLLVQIVRMNVAFVGQALGRAAGR
jgi:Peptidase family M28